MNCEACMVWRQKEGGKLLAGHVFIPLVTFSFKLVHRRNKQFQTENAFLSEILM